MQIITFFSPDNIKKIEKINGKSRFSGLNERVSAISEIRRRKVFVDGRFIKSPKQAIPKTTKNRDTHSNAELPDIFRKIGRIEMRKADIDAETQSCVNM